MYGIIGRLVGSRFVVVNVFSDNEQREDLNVVGFKFVVVKDSF